MARLEIRWHGRGGMGAKTAALLLGEALIAHHKYAQAFPEYGPERRGAPVKAYTRLDDEPIYIHSGITQPDIVVVLDPRLIKEKETLEGLKENGKLLVNTTLEPGELRKKLESENLVLPQGVKIYTVDASGIAKSILGVNIPNTPMLGALIKISNVMELDEFIEAVEKRLSVKFKDEIVKRNIEAIRKAYEEVKGE